MLRTVFLRFNVIKSHEKIKKKKNKIITDTVQSLFLLK